MAAEENAKAAYALVDAYAIVKMASSSLTDEPRNNDEIIDAASNYSIPLDSSARGTVTATDDDTVELTTLEQWYEFYAVRYPSRGFLERQDHLRQLEQERQRQADLAARERQKQQGGWLSRLFFGGGGGTDDQVTDNTQNQDNDNDSGHEDFIDNDEHDDVHLVNNNHDDGMCGTTSSLDSNAITKEAMAFHRFHLVSERRALCTKDHRAHDNQWHVVLPIRNCVGMDEDYNENEQRSTYCIVGYGKIAEFPSLPSSSPDDEQLPTNGAKVTLTSDRGALCQFVNDRNHDSLSDLRHTRAVFIGPDCLVVSWGRGDGFVVIYRRVQRHNNRGNKKERILEVGWNAVAVIAPTDAVANEGLKNMTPSPYISGDNEQQEIASLFESGPLRVTDLVPMIIKNDSTNDQDHSTSAILAISRLGGYIELVPMPNQIWSRYARPPTPPLNQLPNITGMVNVTAISTGQHHVDIMGLDAYRTCIGSISECDGEDDQGAPPAEIILASCGRSADTGANFVRDGKECVTMWGITIAHLQPQGDERDKEDSSCDVGVNEITSMNIGQLGADSTVFCPGIASDHWTNDVSTGRPHKPDETSCSITVKAPFTSLRFSPRKSDDIFLAALDYHGGITILDSTQIVAFGEHKNEAIESDSSTPLLSIISSREQSLPTATRQSCEATFTSQIEWWCPPQSRETHLAAFSVVRKRHRKNKSATMKSIIQLYNVSVSAGVSGNVTIPVCNSIHSNIAPKGGGTALLPASHHALNKTLTFVKFSDSRQQMELSICGVHTILDPSQMITLLLERSDPEKALSVARRFGGAEHFGGTVMNQCRMKLWEDQMDAKALRLVSDDKYVIKEAVNLIGLKSQECNELHLDTLLEVYREGLHRCEQMLSTEQNVDTDWLLVNASRLRHVILSFGTFKLLLQYFMKGSLQEEDFTDEFTRRFLNFQCITVFEVAECAAVNCDIGALTIIFARHRLTLQERMVILDQIPSSMDLTLFQHLLPCYGGGNSTEGGYLPSAHPQVFMTLLEFFSHLADTQLHGQQTAGGENVDVFTDDTDRKFILESLSLNGQASLDERKPVTKDDVAAWYLKRAINLHKETGQIALFTNACELGLKRLGLLSLSSDGESKDVNIHLHTVNSGKLYYVCLAARFLQSISEDKLRESLVLPDCAAETSSSESTQFRSLPQFCSTSIANTFSYIVQSDGATFNRSMFDEHVKSYMGSDQYFEPAHLSAATDADVLSEKVRKDVVRMCISKVTSVRTNNINCRKRKHMDCDGSLSASSRLENALSTCLYFASLGNTMISSSARVVRNDDDLVDFVEEVFRSMIIAVNDDWDLITKNLLQITWSLFELLPFDGFLPKQAETPDSKESEIRNGLIGAMYFKLVALQLFCKWRRHDSLPCALKTFLLSQVHRENVTTSSDCKQYISLAGYDLVAFLCCSFSVQVDRGCDEDLLFDFISDTEDVDQRFFSGTIQSSGSLGRLLVPLLLKHQSFEALQAFLKLRQKWLDGDHVSGVIRSFVVDRMSSDLSIYGSDAPSVGLECMRIIGPLFPNLCDVFEHQHRLFDAKNFTSDTMNVNNDVIGKVFNISHSKLATIECLIQECPQSLLIGCEFWGDNLRSRNACVDALQYFSVQIGSAMSGNAITDSELVLPPMPGGFIMQLANILGINTPFDTLMVKKLMLMGALQESLAYAAIAICYSMLADAAFADNYTDSCRSVLLGCIDAILLDQTFVNSFIKKDLCIQSVKLLSASNTSFDTLLETFYNLEYESFMTREQAPSEGDHRALHDPSFLERVARQAREFTSTGNQNISSLSGSKNIFSDGSLCSLLREIKEATTTDLLPLLSSLRGETTSNKPSLEIISRTVLSWISSKVMIDKMSATNSALSSYNVIVMVELVSCCLNELDDTTSFDVIDRAVEAIESSTQQGYSTTIEHIQPDQAIVERLNGRGYGWNASRRAAIMTKNQGYSEALAWAVSHFQDDDFDSPLYILQDESAPCRVEKSLENIRKLLVALQASVRQPSTNSNGHSCVVDAKKLNSNGESDGNSSSRTDFTVVETAAQSMKTTTTFSNGNSNGISSARKKAPPPLPTVASPNVVNTNAMLQTKDVRELVSSPAVETLSSFEGSIGSRSSIKKQVSRGGTTLGTKKLSLDERKKL